MDQRADMPDEKHRKWRGCLPYVLGFFLLFAFLFLYSVIQIRHECVVMPNGFLIGRATVFSSMTGWDPDIAIKYPDGRLFLRGDRGMDFWDHDSFGGDFYDTPGGRSDSYIYLNDLGLILKSEQPELYQSHHGRKVAGHRSSAPMVGGHVFRTFLLLYEDPDNRRNWCPTAWS